MAEFDEIPRAVMNYRHSLEAAVVASPGEIAQGQVVAIGLLSGVAAHSAREGDPLNLLLTGIFDLPTDGPPLEVGAPVYVADGALGEGGAFLGVSLGPVRPGVLRVAVGKAIGDTPGVL
jgi:predicted RecA/RadA family phage recombinase